MPYGPHTGKVCPLTIVVHVLVANFCFMIRLKVYWFTSQYHSFSCGMSFSDQLPVSTKYDLRSDPGVEKNYGKLLLEMVSVVPDGIVCFFVSYSYMDGIVNSWHETGLLKVIIASDLSQNFQRELYLYFFFFCNLPSFLVHSTLSLLFLFFYIEEYSKS